MKDTIRLNLPVRMVAHRGVSGLERENTCAAFVAAGNRSHWGVETDVHVTADGQYVIIHDDTTDRVAGVHHEVEETDLATLRALHLQDVDGQPRADLLLPTLEEYIGICKRYEKHCVLELKNHMQEKDVVGIIGVIRDLGWLDNTVFISFDLPNCLCVRALLPQQPVQYLTGSWQDDLPELLAAQKLDLDIHLRQMNAERAAACHAQGVQVNVWTVDDPAEAKALADCGVDYITSNILE